MVKTNALLFTALVLIMSISLWNSPRLFGLYRQIQGGRLLEQAIKLNQPESSSLIPCALSTSSHVSQVSDLLSRAERELAKAIEVDGKDPHAYLLLGRVNCLASSFEKAISAYKIYTTYKPDNPLGLIELGSAYQAAGEIEDAVSAWKSAGLTATDLVESGLKAQAEGKENEAIWFIQSAANFEPESAQPWYRLAQANLALQDFEAALVILEKGVASPSIRYGKSNLYYQMGDLLQYRIFPPKPKDAWVAYEKALQADDFSLAPEQLVSTIHNRGVLLAWRGMWELAAKEYETALTLNPSSYWTHIALARALWMLKQTEQAIGQVQFAIEINPSQPVSFQLLGDFYRELGDFEIAREMYRQALEIIPGAEEILKALETLPTEQTVPSDPVNDR